MVVEEKNTRSRPPFPDAKSIVTMASAWNHRESRFLFAYGTLLHANGRSDVDAAIRECTRDCGPARLRGALYALHGYPGALPFFQVETTASDAIAGEDCIHGRLLQVTSPEKLWPVIDAYEDYRADLPEASEFAPVRVIVESEQGTIEAAVFAYCRSLDGCHRIASGNWLEWRNQEAEMAGPRRGIAASAADGILARYRKSYGILHMTLGEALGHALAEPVFADRDLPPYDRVAMDGIAVAGSAWDAGVRTFVVEGSQRAGEPRKTLKRQDGCLLAMTGAILPEGCDRVVRIEDLALSESSLAAAAAKAEVMGQSEGRGKSEDAATTENVTATVHASLEASVYPAFKNVHRRGADKKLGQVVLSAGQRLRGPEIAIAASVGAVSVPVLRKPKVAVITTGDELVPVSASPLEHQVRHSNGPALQAALAPIAAEVIWTHLPDDEAALRAGLAKTLSDCDVLIMTGGVSMGERDLVPHALAAVGVREKFHKVKQKPGKPLWFGVTSELTPGGEGRLVFGLPGNPMSVLFCFRRYVVPTLAWCAGLAGDSRLQPRLMPLSQEQKKGASDMLQMLPCRIVMDKEGRAWAETLPHQGSGDFSSLAGSDGLICLDPTMAGEAQATFAKGTLGSFYPWT